jgi:hypothetical protein
MYVDQNFIRPGPRFGRLADAQRLDPVEAVAEYRAHVLLRLPWSGLPAAAALYVFPS